LADALVDAGVPLWGRPDESPRRPGAALALLRTLRSFDPDIVHTHLYAADMLASLVSPLSRGRRLVRTLHNTSIQGTRSRTGTQMLDRMFHLSVACGTAVAHAYEDYFGGQHRSRLAIVPNGVPLPAAERPPHAPDVRDMLRRALGIAPDAFVFVHVGAFRGRSLATAQKGQDVLLKAMARLLAEPDAAHAHLLLIGDGELHDAAYALAGFLQVDTRTTFAGTVGDVSHYLWASDAFVFPSRYEGLPVALIEACVAGLPAITTDLPEIAEVLGVRPHTTAPVDDADALAARMAACLRNPKAAKAEARETAARVARDYAIDTCALRYEALYAHLLSNA
jgi:glycosyltransferase involved in cell wall biosynthesis